MSDKKLDILIWLNMNWVIPAITLIIFVMFIIQRNWWMALKVFVVAFIINVFFIVLLGKATPKK